ncbi:sigma-70 family RNA polymerase sigma factor [Anaerotignum sp.]|uniref:RNA polymerase sigma factor n=1 Tax=Anaerotignum sp. TaxID=2039241 RepID=UPI003319D1A1
MPEFNEIYDKYFKDVYRYALCLSRNKFIAEEITQETFFKALKGIESFDGNCKLYVWLCQIAKNTYFSYLRKEQRLNQSLDSENVSNNENIEKQFLTKESAIQIHKALHNLQEPYKEVFTLRIFGELSFAQIGEIFQKTESWARITYHRAKIKLKENAL